MSIDSGTVCVGEAESKLNAPRSATLEAHNIVEFTLAPRGDGTEVTWTMRGASPFVARLIGVFVDMDRMIGRDFEAGLANLKALAERP